MTLLFALVCSGTLLGQEEVVNVEKEYKVKAVYLYSLGRFTTWPEISQRQTDATFVIGVLGNSRITGTLNKIAQKRTIHDLPITIKQFDNAADIGVEDCRLLFVAKTTPTAEVAALLRKLRDSPILTVTESPSHRVTGAACNLNLEGAGVGLEINLQEAQHKQLKLDARLLRQGKKMTPAQPPPG